MNKYWFKPKEVGYGSGLPRSWEGWALTAAYIAAMVFCASNMRGLAAGVLFVLATAAYIWLVHAKTEGGWRWRWGRDK